MASSDVLSGLPGLKNRAVYSECDDVVWFMLAAVDLVPAAQPELPTRRGKVTMRDLADEARWLTSRGEHDAAQAIARKLQEQESAGLAQGDLSVRSVEEVSRQLIRSGFAKS